MNEQLESYPENFVTSLPKESDTDNVCWPLLGIMVASYHI